MDITKELPTVISFCSGYGGIERGLELTGVEHRVIAYVEIEAYAIANLVSKMETGQLPPAPIYTDIKTFPSEVFRDKADIITGGYPCQPFSAAGKRKGGDDPRHLWPYIRQHVETIRPAQCFFENVEGHISLGLNSVISDLEEDGYSTTWGIFGTKDLGFIHERKRVYILAHSNCQRCLWRKNNDRVSERFQKSKEVKQSVVWCKTKGRIRNEPSTGFRPKPLLDRRIDGTSNRVDRIRLLGNGVVPQTAARAWEVLAGRLAHDC